MSLKEVVVRTGLVGSQSIAAFHTQQRLRGTIQGRLRHRSPYSCNPRHQYHRLIAVRDCRHFRTVLETTHLQLRQKPPGNFSGSERTECRQHERGGGFAWFTRWLGSHGQRNSENYRRSVLLLFVSCHSE